MWMDARDIARLKERKIRYQLQQREADQEEDGMAPAPPTNALAAHQGQGNQDQQELLSRITHQLENLSVHLVHGGRGPPPNQEQARGPRRQAQEYHCYNCGENDHDIVIYKDPVKFTAGMSFVTSFSFQIITTASYGICGSGFAFFISDSKQAPTQSGARYLGLVNPNARNENEVSDIFAIEFDTHVSGGLNDPSASHIGIDINSVVSLAYADSSPRSSFYPRVFLYNNYTFTAWIDYIASLNLIQVWMTNLLQPLQHL
ncbi:hypothetical protein L7F22_049134 [Adiantum nelumboides]|nr:hypothetical protein [Adiantum nelumboides]